MGQLDGKVAVITGGASGIGLATARRLRDEGATVVIIDRDGDGAAKVAAELGGSSIQGDVGLSAVWKVIAEEIERLHDSLDIIYLNAGVTTGEGDITAVTDEQYRRIMGPNVDGVVFGLRALVPFMERTGGGAIVATASLAGLIGFAPDPIYTLTKHAVVGLVRAVAPQLSDRGITINAICPGVVDTPLVGEQMKGVLDSVGFPLMPPEQIAEAVLGAVTGAETGQALVCQVGIAATPYHFSRPPGPRVDGEPVGLPPDGAR
jgi:NAD(P)-dependent dehydrogenase (short-subunit alcohol dehydrogenase family)